MLRKLTHWFKVIKKTTSAIAPANHGSLPETKSGRFGSLDILEAEAVGIILGDVGKFVSGGTGYFGFYSQANICNTLYMLGLWKHVERLYAHHFINSACAKNVQVTR